MIPALLFIIKYLPTIEPVIVWLYDDWVSIRKNYEAEKALSVVKKALSEANTEEINSILGKDE